MIPREIEQYFIDFQKSVFPNLIARSLPIFSSMKINVIIGPRRAGKTSMMFQIMSQLVNNGLSRDRILYLNFEDVRLSAIDFKDMVSIVKMYCVMFRVSDPIIFLDEPQNINGWDGAVRDLFDKHYRIFITGSSSKLLSMELATSLRGRSVSHLLMPFSFKEFLSLKGIIFTGKLSTDENVKIESMSNEYILYGGFPEVILENNAELKSKIIMQYLDLIIYKDIVDRYKLRDSLMIKWFLKSLISNHSGELSIHKIYSTLKSQGRKISKDELYSYYSMLIDAMIIFPVQKISWSPKKITQNKVYLADVSFANMLSAGGDIGKRMENIVYLELLKNKKLDEEIFFWKDTQQYEADFIIRSDNNVSQILQVCANIDASPTKEREIRAILKAGKDLGCNDLCIITKDYESVDDAEWFGIKGRIKYIPIWKWLIRE